MSQQTNSIKPWITIIFFLIIAGITFLLIPKYNRKYIARPLGERKYERIMEQLHAQNPGVEFEVMWGNGYMGSDFQIGRVSIRGKKSELRTLEAIDGYPIKEFIFWVVGLDDLSFLRGRNLERVVLYRCFIRSFRGADHTCVSKDVTIEECLFPSLDGIGQLDCRILLLGRSSAVDFDKCLAEKEIEVRDLINKYGKQLDLSPIALMKLKEFSLNIMAVKDFEALRGMELERFEYINVNPEPNEKDSLRELKDGREKKPGSIAYRQFSPVSLEPLKNSKLQYFTISNTPVNDISFLAGMPLKFLDIAGTKVSDLSPAAGAPLEQVYIFNTKVIDLSPLKGMKLKWLNIGHTKVTDISVLSGMPLKYLTIRNTRIADLSPIKGMPLDNLVASEAGITDLTSLKGAHIKSLNIAYNNVTDIKPLTGVSGLTTLDLSGTQVSDLSPLRKMNVGSLFLSNRVKSDLSGIKGMDFDLFVIPPDGGVINGKVVKVGDKYVIK